MEAAKSVFKIIGLTLLFSVPYRVITTRKMEVQSGCKTVRTPFAERNVLITLPTLENCSPNMKGSV